MSKQVVAPWLLAALEHYSVAGYSWERPTLFIYTEGDGARRVQRLVSLQQTLDDARSILEVADLSALKFESLRQGMKDAGMGRLYEHLMREDIDAGKLL